MMAPNVQQSWEDFLNPAVLRPRLISASIFIAGFESLKESTIDRIRSFFCNGFDEDGYIISPVYQRDVLSRNRSPLHASLDWLKENGAIDDADVATFGRVKTCRNHLAHHLLKFLGTEGVPPDFEECFQEMIALHRKIEVWWIMNVEIPTDPGFEGQEIDEDVICPGPMILLQLLYDIALGSDEQSRIYYDEFQRQSN